MFPYYWEKDNPSSLSEDEIQPRSGLDEITA